MKRLSKRDIFIIDCMHDWPDLIKQANKENILGVTHVLNPEKIIRLYELEYKLFKLNSLNSSFPSTLKTIERIENELSSLLPELLKIMEEIFSTWIKFHSQVIDPGELLPEVQKEFPEIRPEKLEDEYLDYQMGNIAPHHDAFKKKEIQMQKEMWTKPPLSSILNTYKSLQKGPTGNVGNDDALFNHALNTAHFGGPFLNYFADTTGISGDLLSALSEGKFTDKWDTEISRFAEIHISKRAEKKSGVGVFISIPSDLAKKFKSLGEHDESKPHITVLYIGKNVPKKKEKIMTEAIEKILSETSPFEIKLDDKVTYFDPTKHSDNCKVAKINIISKELHTLHDKLKKSLKENDIEIDDHFPDYKPHVTLEYMEPPKETYEDEIPAGSFVADLAEIWGSGNKKKVNFGKKSKKAYISKRASFDGGWLSPEGRFYPVEFHAHTEFIARHPELFGEREENETEIYNRAFHRGWIRIAFFRGYTGSNHLNIEFPSEDNKYLNRVQKILPEFPKADVVHLSFLHGGYIKASYQDFIEARSLRELEYMSKISCQKISKRAMTIYGYWLSPEGKLYPVDWEGHGDFIRANPKFFGYSDHGIYNLAFEKGWIRVTTACQDELDFDLPSFDNKYFQLIKSALPHLPERENVIISLRNSYDYIKAKLWDVVDAQNINELKIHLRHMRASYIPISKRAAKIGYPHKMFDEIMLWARPAILQKSKNIADSKLKDNIRVFSLYPFKDDLRKSRNTKSNISMIQSISSLIGQWIDKYDSEKFGSLNIMQELISGDISKIPTKKENDEIVFESSRNIIYFKEDENNISGRIILTPFPYFDYVPDTSAEDTVKDIPAGDLYLNFKISKQTKKLTIETLDEMWIQERRQALIAYATNIDIEKVGDSFDKIRIGYPNRIEIDISTWNDIDKFTEPFMSYQSFINDTINFDVNWNNIYDHAQIQKELQELSPFSGDPEIEKKFSIDISDTEQWQKHEFIRDNWEKLAPFYKNVTVYLYETNNPKANANFVGNSMRINIFNTIYNIASTGKAEALLVECGRSLKHELVHMMQYVMTELKKLDLATKRFSRTQYCPLCGFKDISGDPFAVCPKCKVPLITRQMGLPGKYDPTKFMPYGYRPETKGEEYSLHAISDVEFFTRLQDATESLKEILIKHTLGLGERVAIMNKFPELIEEIPTGMGITPVWDKQPLKPINFVSDLTPEQKNFLMKYRFETFIKYNETIIALHAAAQYSKLNKFIRELWRVAAEIVKNASLKTISKRAKEPKEIIDEWFEEEKKNPVIKEEKYTKIKDIELWHGVNDAKALNKLPNGKYLLTPKPGSDMQKLWFVPAWNHSSKQVALGYANYALVRVFVPFEFTYIKATKADGTTNEYTESYKPADSKWERSYQVQEWYLHDGALEIDPGQVKFANEMEEEMPSLYASVRPISKLATIFAWWLSPAGKLYPTMSHKEFVLKHPEFFGLSDLPLYERAFSKGWVRIAFNQYYLFFELPSFNDKYLKRIQDALPELPKNKEGIRMAVPSGEFMTVAYWDLAGTNSFYELKRLQIKESNMKLSKRADETKFKAGDKVVLTSDPERGVGIIVGYAKKRRDRIFYAVNVWWSDDDYKLRQKALSDVPNQINIPKIEWWPEHSIEFTDQEPHPLLKEYADKYQVPKGAIVLKKATPLSNRDIELKGVPKPIRNPPQQSIRMLEQMAKDPLSKYKEKRDFSQTKEPEGKVEKRKNQHRYVIQDHFAEKAGHHKDLRLENDQGTMTSFAIPKAKLPEKNEKLLAMETEPHPIGYMHFGKGKGEEISEGYGKGKVKIHSKGKYELVEWKKDMIKFKIPEGIFILHRTDDKKWIIMRGKEN